MLAAFTGEMSSSEKSCLNWDKNGENVFDLLNSLSGISNALVKSIAV